MKKAECTMHKAIDYCLSEVCDECAETREIKNNNKLPSHKQ